MWPARPAAGSPPSSSPTWSGIYARKKAADKELRELVAATGTGLLDLHGIGPSGAARLLVEVGDITRFPDRNHFASWTGTAPIDASSGDHVRHRLSRGGNRQINRALHIMATVQLRNQTDGRAYYDRKKASGKSLDGSHALPQTTAVRHRLPHHARRHRRTRDAAAGQEAAGPGGQRGNDSDSSATGSQPQHRLFGQATPGPANHSLNPHSHGRLDTEGSHERTLPGSIQARVRLGSGPKTKLGGSGRLAGPFRGFLGRVAVEVLLRRLGRDEFLVEEPTDGAASGAGVAQVCQGAMSWACW